MKLTMENLLNNQSKEMATIVETFLIEETVELIYDGEALENWNKLVDELGLTGQTQIAKKEKSPIPFMHMKRNLVAVFETLCPRKVDAITYNITPIPLEILRLISLSTNEKYFDKIQIWYDDKAPDPVCVGLRYATEKDREQKYSWNMEAYLLGKWADVRRSFEELTQMATKRFIQEKGHEYRKTLKDTQRRLDDLEIEAFEKFGTDVNANDNLPF